MLYFSFLSSCIHPPPPPQLSRNQRFSASFHHTVETLVNMMMPHITQKYKDNLDAARNANHSLAVFIKVGSLPPIERAQSLNKTTFGVKHQNKIPNVNLFSFFSPQRCFTLMDRGFVFKQINNYMNCFVPGDPKVRDFPHQALFYWQFPAVIIRFHEV